MNRIPRDLAAKTGRTYRACVEALKRWTSHVWTRLTTEPGYADAVAGVAFTLAELFVTGHRLRRALQELARTFAGLLRALRDEDPGYHEWS